MYSPNSILRKNESTDRLIWWRADGNDGTPPTLPTRHGRTCPSAAVCVSRGSLRITWSSYITDEYKCRSATQRCQMMAMASASAAQSLTWTQTAAARMCASTTRERSKLIRKFWYGDGWCLSQRDTRVCAMFWKDALLAATRPRKTRISKVASERCVAAFQFPSPPPVSYATLPRCERDAFARDALWALRLCVRHSPTRSRRRKAERCIAGPGLGPDGGPVPCVAERVRGPVGAVRRQSSRMFHRVTNHV